MAPKTSFLWCSRASCRYRRVSCGLDRDLPGAWRAARISKASRMIDAFSTSLSLSCRRPEKRSRGDALTLELVRVMVDLLLKKDKRGEVTPHRGANSPVGWKNQVTNGPTALGLLRLLHGPSKALGRRPKPARVQRVSRRCVGVESFRSPPVPAVLYVCDLDHRTHSCAV